MLKRISVSFLCTTIWTVRGAQSFGHMVEWWSPQAFFNDVMNTMTIKTEAEEFVH